MDFDFSEDQVALRDAYQTIFKTYKRLDVLVNNAGILEDALLGMLTPESVERTFATNALAVLYNMQLASRLMARHKRGSIVNVTSIIGTHGNAGQVSYGGSKAAVIGMTHSAAKELAPGNIRVNAVAPGPICVSVRRSGPSSPAARCSGARRVPRAASSPAASCCAPARRSGRCPSPAGRCRA